MSDKKNDEKTEEEFEQTIDALRALIGGSPVARTVVKTDAIVKNSDLAERVEAKKRIVNKAKSHSSQDNTVDFDNLNLERGETSEPFTNLPKAVKTLNAGDFLRVKRHNSAQAQAMLKAFVEKHGKLSADSKELKILVSAIKRILRR